MIELVDIPKASRWLKIKEACQYANMSEKVLRRHLLNGDIYGTKRRGGVWIVDRESIDQFYLSENRDEDEKYFDFKKRARLK